MRIESTLQYGWGGILIWWPMYIYIMFHRKQKAIKDKYEYENTLQCQIKFMHYSMIVFKHEKQCYIGK